MFKHLALPWHPSLFALRARRCSTFCNRNVDRVRVFYTMCDGRYKSKTIASVILCHVYYGSFLSIRHIDPFASRNRTRETETERTCVRSVWSLFCAYCSSISRFVRTISSLVLHSFYVHFYDYGYISMVVNSAVDHDNGCKVHSIRFVW